MIVHCKYDKLVKPSSLKDHPKNRNKHGSDQIERLAKLYQYHGIRHPIVVSNRSKCIVAGHGRKLAAIRAGVKEVPVVYQDFDSDEAEYAFIQADNAIALWADLDLSGINSDLGDLGPDFDIDMLGIKNFVIEPADKDRGCDEDEVPERVEPKTKLGDIYQLGRHRLMCGDSTSIDAVEKLMNGEKADMVFTDPPYGDNMAGFDFRGLTGDEKLKSFKRNTIKNDDDLSFLKDVAANIIIVCKERTPKIVFFKWSKWEEIKACFEVFGSPSSCCVWDRVRIATAQFIFNPVHEFAFFWGSLLEKQNTSNLTNVWRCKKELETKDLHPTVKPIEIIEGAIDAACVGHGLVIDLFGGSGSTLIACEKTNRKCFMMELDPHYCDVIVARWEKYTGQKAELINAASSNSDSNLVEVDNGTKRGTPEETSVQARTEREPKRWKHSPARSKGSQEAKR